MMRPVVMFAFCAALAGCTELSGDREIDANVGAPGTSGAGANGRGDAFVVGAIAYVSVGDACSQSHGSKSTSLCSDDDVTEIVSATITGPFTIEGQAVVGRRAQIRARASSEGTATLTVSVKVGGMTRSTTASLRAFVPDDAAVTIGGCNTVPTDSTVRASVTLKGKGESLSGGNAPDYLTTTGLLLLHAETTPSPSALYRTESAPGIATIATTLGLSSVTVPAHAEHPHFRPSDPSTRVGSASPNPYACQRASTRSWISFG